MTEKELVDLLDKLRNLPGETEVVEFKEAKNSYDFYKMGKYFSALSNEANLLGKPFAWLVLGVEDNNHKIVGTAFRTNRRDLDSLKGEMARRTSGSITFIEIHELFNIDGRVVLLQIPAAPKGLPVAFDGHYYGRNGEELSALNIEELERIRIQNINTDWSAEIVKDAGINDLDPKAIAVARANYRDKFPSKASEVESWDDITFLNKAKLTIKGKITRTAIILLGREESEHFINPSEAKIRWILKDNRGVERDYAIETCPLLLAVDKIYSRIRNLKYRYLKPGSLTPDEVDRYEPYSIREAINNCIAHQDYMKGGRINVIETDDELIFTNYGSFIPGSVEKVIREDAPEEFYRNRFLATAMVNLKMVDTIGSGIRKIFNFQRQRFFPMPDYDLSENKVKVSIIGKTLDINYATILAQNDALTLEEIIMLDKVQKKKRLLEAEEKYLKQHKLIEGRKPNYFISIDVAQKTGQKALYTKNKAFDKSYYCDLIENAIQQHAHIDRKVVDELLWDRLPEWMDETQKRNKITSLLTELRKKNKIKNCGSDAKPMWIKF